MTSWVSKEVQLWANQPGEQYVSMGLGSIITGAYVPADGGIMHMTYLEPAGAVMDGVDVLTLLPYEQSPPGLWKPIASAPSPTGFGAIHLLLNMENEVSAEVYRRSAAARRPFSRDDLSEVVSYVLDAIEHEQLTRDEVQRRVIRLRREKL